MEALLGRKIIFMTKLASACSWFSMFLVIEYFEVKVRNWLQASFCLGVKFNQK
jgi:hypothetical protein